jgi:hypothetical protein
MKWAYKNQQLKKPVMNYSDLESEQIWVDTYLITYLLRVNKIHLLTSFYKERVFLLDLVRETLSQSLLREIESDNICQPYVFPTDDEWVSREYFRLKKERRSCEAACMAVARYKGGIIASSPLQSMQDYCVKYEIKLLTGAEIVELAEGQNILNDSVFRQSISHSVSTSSPDKILR